jgi:plasmid stability protein
MAQVVIRNLDERVVDTLRTKARLHGRSLEQQLRDILNAAATLSTEEKLAVIDEFRARTPPGPQTDSVELLRESRDERGRHLSGEGE